MTYICMCVPNTCTGVHPLFQLDVNIGLAVENLETATGSVPGQDQVSGVITMLLCLNPSST